MEKAKVLCYYEKKRVAVEINPRGNKTERGGVNGRKIENQI
jgi:hypothetical protein